MNKKDKNISFEKCCEIINEHLLLRVELLIKEWNDSPSRLELGEGEVTFEEYIKRTESDGRQKTQALTKFLQYLIADALKVIITDFNLPLENGDGAGHDYKYTGNYYKGKRIKEPVLIEFKTHGGQDGASICSGNLGVNQKCELTLVCRYELTGNVFTGKQIVTIDNSSDKWKNYNPKVKNGNNYASLKCKSATDVQDIVCYSGKIVKNQVWVHFFKETISKLDLANNA